MSQIVVRVGFALFILSEAYKCGGSMEIRFTEHVEGGRVPEAICELAERVDSPIPDESIVAGRISPDEARCLYAGITGFPSELRARVDELDAQGRLLGREGVLRCAPRRLGLGGNRKHRDELPISGHRVKRRDPTRAKASVCACSMSCAFRASGGNPRSENEVAGKFGGFCRVIGC